MSGAGGGAAEVRTPSHPVDAGLLARVGIPLAAVVLACIRIWPGIGPESLFLDDQWVAIALRDTGIAERLTLDMPMPVGFAVLAGLPGAIVGDPHLALQVLPIAAYLVSVGLFPVLVHRLTGSPLAAALGAALFVAAPLTPAFAVRVKHYTLDQLVTVGILLAMPALFRTTAPRRFLLWATALAGCALLSFASVFLSLAAVCTACAAVWLREGDDARRMPFAAVTGAFLTVLGVFFLLYVRRASRPIMIDFWAEYFPSFDSLGSVAAFFSDRVGTFFLLAVPEWAGILTLLVPVGGVALWRSGRRAYCVALLAFYAGVLAAAMVHAYPMGTGRTDSYAFAVTTLLVTLGAVAVLDAVRNDAVRRGLYATSVAALVLATVLLPGATYPESDDRAAVEWTLDRIDGADALVLSPYAVFALQLYGEPSGTVVPEDYYGHGFDVVPARPAAFTTAVGRWDVSSREAVVAELRRLSDFVAEGPDRLLYLETHGVAPGRADVLAVIGAGGYELVESTGLGGLAEAYLFRRTNAS